MRGSSRVPSSSQKLWQILTPNQRRGAIALLGLSLIGMVLETLGIGLVIPALALMTHADLALRYPRLVPLLSSLGNPTHKQLVITGMMTLVGVYAVKAMFLGLLAWQQMRFVYGV